MTLTRGRRTCHRPHHQVRLNRISRVVVLNCEVSGSLGGVRVHHEECGQVCLGRCPHSQRRILRDLDRPRQQVERRGRITDQVLEPASGQAEPSLRFAARVRHRAASSRPMARGASPARVAATPAHSNRPTRCSASGHRLAARSKASAASELASRPTASSPAAMRASHADAFVPDTESARCQARAGLSRESAPHALASARCASTSSAAVPRPAALRASGCRLDAARSNRTSPVPSAGARSSRLNPPIPRAAVRTSHGRRPRERSCEPPAVPALRGRRAGR